MTERNSISDVYVEGIIVTNGIIVRYRTKDKLDEFDVTDYATLEIINDLVDGAKRKEFSKINNRWCEKYIVLPAVQQHILTGLEKTFLENIKPN